MRDITLIVLAAGAGKRFWPLTTSKALFPFFGSPVFSYMLAGLPKEIKRIIVVTSPENDRAIRNVKFPVPASTVIQKTPDGMGDAMLACATVIGPSPIVVVNADDIIDPELISRVIETDAFGAIPGRNIQSHGPFGYLVIDGDTVQGIVEKPAAGREPSQFVNVVCHYISDASVFIHELSRVKRTSDDVYETALSTIMATNRFVFVPYDGPFLTLKYPWQVLDAMSALLGTIENKKGKHVQIRPHVVIEGPVFIGDNVKIFEFTKIVGPCYIGDNAIIGNNSIIRASHIGAGSVIGYGCDITRSYIGDTCWLHNNYIGDSVLEHDVSMGGGAKLANLRLDDGEIKGTGRNKLGAIIARGVRIGVNASIMPGIQIGKNTFIGSGVVLDKDVPENSFCMAKPGYTVSKNLKKAIASRDGFKTQI